MADEHGNVSLPMSKPDASPWWIRGITASVIVVVIGAVWLLARQGPRVPAYRGKSLPVWLRTYAESSSSGRHSREWNEADDAVRHMGTNCVPVLLRMIREKDAKLKLLAMSWAQKQRLVRLHFVAAAERNVEASRAFIVLGDSAKGAVPALVEMYDEDLSAESRSAIGDALAWIGPAAKSAVPVLVRGAGDPNARVRANALWALGEIRAKPELCVPVLIHALMDSNDWVRLSGAHALGMFGAEARSAVPSLRQLTNSVGVFGASGTMGVQVSWEARNALRKIDPGVVAPSDQSVPESGIPVADWLLSPQ
jgi:hypothetical protein